MIDKKVNSGSLSNRKDILRESLVINDSMKRLYKMKKSEKYDSMIFNPPSIADQMKQKSLFSNNPVEQVNKSQAGISRYKDKSQESNLKNKRSSEYEPVDKRPKQVIDVNNFLNWTKKENPINLSNY
jgi:hypothetical protein